MTPDQSAFADFLEPLPWRAFATLTTPYKRPQAWWDTAIREWLRAVQSSERKSLVWLLGYEPCPCLHAHLLLAALAPLDCRKAGLRWLPIADTRDEKRAVVVPYDPAQSALAYVSKLYGTSFDDVRLGGPLNSFLGVPPLRPMYARDRRRVIRIQQQRAQPSGGRASSFRRCPKCASYAMNSQNSVNIYECLACGLQDISEDVARRMQ
jgi:hypothetical protein